MTTSLTPENAPKPGLRTLLANRNFRLIFSAELISLFGDGLTNLALLLLVNHLTGSTGAIAVMAIVLLIPQLTFGLISGVFVDRLNRQTIMVVSDLLRGLLVLSFILVNSADMIWLLYIVGFLQASVGTFFTPARNAILPQLIPTSNLMSANSMMQTGQIFSMTTGSMVAGLAVGAFQAYWLTFSIDAVTFLLSALLVSRLKTDRHTPPTSKATVKIIFKQLREGLFITFTTRELLGTMVVAGICLLGLGAINVLFVPYLVNVLKTPPELVGVVSFMESAGAIVGGSLVTVLAVRFKPTSLIVGGVFLMGVFLSLQGVVTDFWQYAFLLVGVVFMCMPVNAAISTINQTAVANELRGRVSAARAVVTSVANLLSMSFAGIFGDLVGIRNVFIAAGVLAMFASLCAWLVFRPGIKERATTDIPPVAGVAEQAAGAK